MSDSASFIKEMFKDIDEETIERLIKSHGDNIDLIVTRILDGSYKGFVVDIKDLAINRISQKKYRRDLYYPELFRSIHTVDDKIDVWIARLEAKECHEKINQYNSKDLKTKTKMANDYYSQEIQKLKDKADSLNRQAAMAILKRSMSKGKDIDLHGLFCKEALMFLSDFIEVNRPKTISLVTGSEGNSAVLGPSLTKFLEEKNYSVKYNGPILTAEKKPFVS